MAYIGVSDVQRWTNANSDKLIIDSIDAGLETAESSIVLSRLASAFDTSGWTNDTNTPALIKTIISMRYTSFYINSIYLEDEDLSAYAALLLAESDSLLEGIIVGSVTVPGIPSGGDTGLHGPVFYPTDLSSTLEAAAANPSDRSLGPAKFSMGQVF